MKHGKTKAIACLLLFINIISNLFTVNGYACSEKAVAAFDYDDDEVCPAISNDIRISSRFLELLRGKEGADGKKLLVGGGVFGLRIREEGVTVTETRQGSALSIGDRIVSVNGERINEIADVEKALHGCCGKPIKLSIIRSGEELTLNVTPRLEEDGYRLGVTLRKSASGLGTVTFIDPETKIFGGLGHGVCNTGSGELLKIESGTSTEVILGGVKKGEIGKPGELSGILGNQVTGSIICNDECGVFGVASESFDTSGCELMSIGKKDELSCGTAEIISTVKNGKTARYKIEITDIDYSSTGSKSFKIKVTDPFLIALTGGIVRGMSGSPIIQDGKLVGAVTHVMVANPTEGYGIFIENMLNSAQSQATPKAA